tara:strand:- start:3944 stop:4408 length:465 start_codon:yes stop_codon:yes gene_type:complete
MCGTVSGPEQAALEPTFEETNEFPAVIDRSSLACLLKASERRIWMSFQNRQCGPFLEDTRTIASLGMNTILLLCMYTYLRPDVPYDSMVRHVASILSSAGDEADTLVRHHTYTFIDTQARKIRSETIDEHTAVYIVTTGLITRVTGVLGITDMQ